VSVVAELSLRHAVTVQETSGAAIAETRTAPDNKIIGPGFPQGLGGRDMPEGRDDPRVLASPCHLGQGWSPPAGRSEPPLRQPPLHQPPPCQLPPPRPGRRARGPPGGRPLRTRHAGPAGHGLARTQHRAGGSSPPTRSRPQPRSLSIGKGVLVVGTHHTSVCAQSSRPALWEGSLGSGRGQYRSPPGAVP
jgi:hypothetical protein